MKYAAIEIGTNSTKMIIVQKDASNSFSVLHKSTTVNRLSRNMFENRMLQQEALNSGMNIIRSYMKDIEASKAELVSVFSTSVLRDANNSSLFMAEVKKQCGCDIDVISGNQEAFYAYKAASGLMESEHEKSIVVDIGGGSTEIIYGDKRNIDHRISLDIGAVRLTQLYCKSDRLANEQICQVTKNIRGELDELPDMAHKKAILIGTGGTIKTMATVFSNSDYSDESKIHGLVVPGSAVNDIFHELANMDVEARKAVKGLDPKRADVIIAGLQILQEVMRKFKASQIKISSAGVLEGFMEQYISLHS